MKYLAKAAVIALAATTAGTTTAAASQRDIVQHTSGLEIRAVFDLYRNGAAVPNHAGRKQHSECIQVADARTKARGFRIQTPRRTVVKRKQRRVTVKSVERLSIRETTTAQDAVGQFRDPTKHVSR